MMRDKYCQKIELERIEWYNIHMQFQCLVSYIHRNHAISIDWCTSVNLPRFQHE